MSGGAYEYFSTKDPCDLSPYKETCEEIERDMAFYCHFDVSDVRSRLQVIAMLMDMANKRFESIQHLLRTFEWWMSGDYGEDQFRAEVEKWREEERKARDGQKALNSD